MMHVHALKEIIHSVSVYQKVNEQTLIAIYLSLKVSGYQTCHLS